VPSRRDGKAHCILKLRFVRPPLLRQGFDGEAGAHYNYFRDYEPTVGRYIQSDPIGLQAGANTFSYVSSRPLSVVDPEGLLGSPFPGQPDPKTLLCAFNPGNPSCQPNWPLNNPSLVCKIQCNFKYQWVCSGLSLFMGLVPPRSASGAAFVGIGCLVIKAVICDHECDKKHPCPT
jgi:RHS repeat-associated protein